MTCDLQVARGSDIVGCSGVGTRRVRQAAVNSTGEIQVPKKSAPNATITCARSNAIVWQHAQPVRLLVCIQNGRRAHGIRTSRAGRPQIGLKNASITACSVGLVTVGVTTRTAPPFAASLRN